MNPKLPVFNPEIQKPIGQPSFVNKEPVQHTSINSIKGIPQPNEYSTPLEPVFVQHLSRHINCPFAVMTVIGRLEGILAGVAVDHIQINTHDRSLHIRISQIVYFEGPLASYK